MRPSSSKRRRPDTSMMGKIAGACSRRRRFPGCSRMRDSSGEGAGPGMLMSANRPRPRRPRRNRHRGGAVACSFRTLAGRLKGRLQCLSRSRLGRHLRRCGPDHCSELSRDPIQIVSGMSFLFSGLRIRCRWISFRPSLLSSATRKSMIFFARLASGVMPPVRFWPNRLI